MPNIPIELTNTNVSADVLNALRNDASVNYQTHIPFVSADGSNLRTIGTIIMDSPTLLNEFISTLVNRIAFTIIESKSYRNRLGFLKKGMIETGETVEDIFVNIAKPFQYDGNANGTKVFGKYKSDVRTAFYVMNAMVMYPVTVNRGLLKTAFNSFGNLDSFIESIIQSTYSAMEYDDQNIMLYLIAEQLRKNTIRQESISVIADEATAKEALVSIRATASKMTMLTSMSHKYNIAGVKNFITPENLVVLLTPEARANLDVQALAGAFNIQYADLENQSVTIPPIAEMDVERLDEIFKNDSNYHSYTPTELSNLANVQMIAMDRNFMQCYDNLLEMAEQKNPASLDWNYFLHHWATYAVSPFANCVVFGAYTYGNYNSAKVKFAVDGLDQDFSVTSNAVTIPVQTLNGKRVMITAIDPGDAYIPQECYFFTVNSGVYTKTNIIDVGTADATMYFGNINNQQITPITITFDAT